MKRSTLALSLLAAVILVLAFFQTPLMRQARQKTWNQIIFLIAKTFHVNDVFENKNLSDSLEQLTSENIRLKAELEDYHRLRMQLGTPSVSNLRPVQAAVLARPADTLQSELLLSKGLADGVAIGDPVVAFGSDLVGFVVEAQPHTATVETIYHPDVHVTAEIINEDEGVLPARGLLESSYYSSLRVTTIPRDIPINDGQSIVTVADSGKIPSGLVIGTVTDVQSPEHDAYQSVRVQLPYDIDTVDAVTILAQP